MRVRVLSALAAAFGAAVALAGPATAAPAASTPPPPTSDAPATPQTLFRPVAVVNDKAITGFDLAQRAQILLALGYPAASADTLRSDALDQLIDDKLKLQAAEQAGIKITPEMVQQGIADIAERAGMEPDAFRAVLNNRGVTNLAIEDLAKANVAWVEVVRARFANRVQPGEAEIDSEMALAAKRSGTVYKVLEIGLPFEGAGRTEAETRALAEQLYEKLNNGGDFAKAVAKYSKSPSAARGGAVGWVSTERMPPDLQQAIDGLQVGQVSHPLPVSGGLTLVKIADKRSTGTAPGDDAQAREAVRARLVNQQSARLAEGLLQEMRRDAMIDVR